MTGSASVGVPIATMAIPQTMPEAVEARVRIANVAIEFFHGDQSDIYAAALESIGQPHDWPFTGEAFRQYLLANEDFFTVFHSIFIHLTLSDLVRAGLLYDGGLVEPEQGVLGHKYQSIGVVTKSQREGNLWLGKALGSILLVPYFDAVTVHITGKTEDGDVAGGSGLILDPGHILTNAHVVKDMTVDGEIKTPATRPPAQEWHEAPPSIKLLVDEAQSHDQIDVAVIPIETTVGQNGINSLKGMAFRDPVWSDETYIFGYPPVSTLDDAYLVVQRGEVVNPAVRSQYGHQWFLYSAIARPGNSGGPIVAQDGRVIGIVTTELPDARQKAEPFYTGVPASQIRQALREIDPGFEHLIHFEDWKF
jgi:V8-like Glu-specific endopeptidase